LVAIVVAAPDEAVVAAAVLCVGVLAGVEAAVELLDELLLPHPASSASADTPAAPMARGLLTVAS
jgi:hypothetical protein